VAKSTEIVVPKQLRIPGSGTEPEKQQSRGARAVPPPTHYVTLADVLLEVIAYVSAHSDDSASLVDATKWKLEAILRSSQ